MNDALPPLDSDELDELLSADLDGELAAAARDRGSDVETLRARIAATPGAPARRASLAAARDALARAPKLDELVEARLRAKAVRAVAVPGAALDTARRARRRRTVLTVSGIAAAVLVIAGIAVVIGRSGSSSTPNVASASAPSAPPVNVAKPVPALGSYSDVRALGSVAVNAARQYVSAQTQHAAAANGHAQGTSAAPQRLAPALSQKATTPAPSTPVADGTGSAMHGVTAFGSDATKRAQAGRADSCAPARYAGAGDRLLMSATATLDGRPVRVYVFAGNGEHTVVVLGASCVLVNVQTLY